MAAIRPLMRRCLPPVGQPVLARRGVPLPTFSGYRAIWTQRGTAALALALRLAMARRPEISCPQVLIPGYGCPDLVAAAHYAGIEPVWIDIGPDGPGFQFAALDRAWSKAVVAVLAVNFLGIAERLQDLSVRAKEHNAWLIEDNAQWFPEPLGGPAPLAGDAVVLSFGRGKPVSILGGGALLLREDQDADPPVVTLPVEADTSLLRLKIAIYNLLIQPSWYGLIGRNRLLHVGETRYAALSSISAMAVQQLDLLGANVMAWTQRNRWQETAIGNVIDNAEAIAVDLPRAQGAQTRRLLRYPLLCRDRETRDQLLANLAAAGLGATAMYREALPWVSGIPIRLDSLPELPGARAFAARLLTLPLHDGVTWNDIERIGMLIRDG